MRARLTPGSLPKDYDETCANLARNGSYVLALACKEIAAGTQMMDIAAWDRDNAECDLKLVGCITFDNFVKANPHCSDIFIFLQPTYCFLYSRTTPARCLLA